MTQSAATVDSLEERDELWRTPLYRAAEEGNLETVKDLLRKGSKVDARAKKRFTALHSAARFGHIAVMEALLQAKADVNKHTIRGMTPLMMACRYSRDAAALLLLKHNCDLSQSDNCGRTALHWAIKLNRSVIMEELIKQGSDISAVDKYNKTPVLQACKSNRPDLLGRLLTLGADFRTADIRHNHPMHMAALLGNKECIRVLYQFDSSLISMPSELNAATPLSYAIMGRQTQTVKFLLDLGAEPNGSGSVNEISALEVHVTNRQYLNVVNVEPDKIMHDNIKILITLLQANVDTEILFPHPLWADAMPPVNAMEACFSSEKYDMAEILARSGSRPNKYLEQIFVSGSSQMLPQMARNIDRLDWFKRFFSRPRTLKEAACRAFRRKFLNVKPYVRFEERIKELPVGLRSYLMFSDIKKIYLNDFDDDDEDDDEETHSVVSESDISNTEREMEPSEFDSDLYGDRSPYESS